MDRAFVHGVSQQVVLEPGLGLTMWVDAEQNGKLSSEPMASGASYKANA